MVRSKKLVIFGTSEIATLANYYFSTDSEYEVVGFCVDDDYLSDREIEDKPIVPFSQVNEIFNPDSHEMHVAISYAKLNRLREAKYHQAKKAGYNLASYVCSKSTYWEDLNHGDNCFILENQTIQPTVQIGSNVVLWSGNHIGHASKVSSHSYIASHVVLCGHSQVGERCFLGVNSAVRDFVSIGNDCFIGMGANVTSNMLHGSVAIASSATIFSEDDRRGKAIKNSFFK